MSVETKLLLICCVAGASALVYAVTRVLGTWFEHHIQRHDLIVASKQKRLEYYKALAERNNPQPKTDTPGEVIEENDSVVVEAA